MMNKLYLFLLKSLAVLPLPFLYLLSDLAYFILYRVVRYRLFVVRDNLMSSFPQAPKKSLRKIERGFYHFLADQMVETLKLLHISDKTLSKRVSVINPEIVNESLNSGRSVVMLMGHFANWEWVQEIGHYFSPEALKVSIYHPLNDKFWNQLFIKLRDRWHSHIIPMKNAARTLMKQENQPWVCGFIADAYTWRKNQDNWVEFLNHKTWFIYGPEEIGKRVGADFFYLEMTRKKRGYYEISFSKIEPADKSIPYPFMREFWKKFEATILRQPSLWLWSHKRWK